MYPVFGDLKNNIKNILVIGAGAYTMPEHLKDYYKNAEVSVIETDPEMITIYVKDNGVGIPEEQQNNIFQKFFRATPPVR